MLKKVKMEIRNGKPFSYSTKELGLTDGLYNFILRFE